MDWYLDTGWGCGGVVTDRDGWIRGDTAPIFNRLRTQNLMDVVAKGRYYAILDMGQGQWNPTIGHPPQDRFYQCRWVGCPARAAHLIHYHSRVEPDPAKDGDYAQPEVRVQDWLRKVRERGTRDVAPPPARDE